MKDYDTTLARMAGNIAAGLAHEENGNYWSSNTEEWIAKRALAIAKAIITKCRVSATATPVATFKGEAPVVLGTVSCHTPACGWDGRSGSTAAVIRFLGHTRVWCDRCGDCWGITEQELREKMV